MGLEDSSYLDVYFAAKEPNDAARIILMKAEKWFHSLDVNGYLNKLKECWSAYHGAYYADIGTGHRLTFSGEQGELVDLPVNHFRNIARHMLSMVTANRPALQARATNTDYKSLVQTRLANGLLDYYMREKHLEDYLCRAIEYAIVFGSGYVKLAWNSTSGEVYDYNEETKTPVYQGDIEFMNLSPFDVVFDSTKEDSTQHNWVLCRSFRNRFDLAAKYPEKKDDILRMETKDKKERYDFNNNFYDQTDDIAVYEFYHKRTEALPDGRYLLFVDSNSVLMDAPMPYRDLPVYRVSPADILGTPYGYTDMFDLLPLQDALNALYSAVLTNQNAFAVQNVLVPRGADIVPTAIAGALNLIEYNNQVGKPEALQLTASPPEVFQMMALLEKTMETLSGVSSVSRGNPEASLKSGNALALVQSMSLQFISSLQQSYVRLIEDSGTGLLNILKDFAAVPRMAMIVGEVNRSYMKEFTGDDLENVNRVIVDVGNPLSKCLAKDTPVLMFDGSIRMVQDIRVNEQIMGPDSKPRTIESIASGQEEMYEIISKDKHRNIKYGCNESHILTLKYCSDDNRYDVKKGDILDISIKDYLKLPNRQKRLLQGFTVGVEFKENNLTVPPYILGAWLGDGHSAVTALTSMDQEIITEWSNYAKSLGLQVRVQENKQPNKSKVYFITSGESSGKPDRNTLLNELKSMEVINNKHIPSLYLNSSRNQRLALLAGLLDTDGHLVSETFLITQKNNKLSENIVYLAKSLGFRVTANKFEMTLSTGEVESYNKITIGGNTHEIPTKLKRKQAKPKSKVRDWLNYGINVVSKGFGTYYGFTLKEEPHFLLGDFTVTHNTTAGRVQMAEQLLQMGLIKNPEQYISVMNYGKLEVMTDGIDRQLLLTRAENEKMVSGEEVQAIATEKHALHIKEHTDVLSDPDLKNDPKLVARVLMHVQQHIDLLSSVNPDILRINGEQPLAPPGGSPANQPNGQPPQSSMNGQVQNVQQAPPTAAADPAAAMGINLPSPANPPAPFGNLPTNPQNIIPG